MGNPERIPWITCALTRKLCDGTACRFWDDDQCLVVELLEAVLDVLACNHPREAEKRGDES